MKIDLTEIYKGLKAWRHERGITAENQKQGYIVNVMEELGELATALREYERFSKPNYPYPKNKKYAEHGIIDALCDISVFTINAGADIPCRLKPLIIETKREFSVASIFVAIADFIRTDVNNSPFVNGSPFNYYDFARILRCCASVCEQYGFNFQIAMDETIKEISSRTGTYDKASKKWVKDESDEAKAKWYQANYELARIEK
ncbi:MAG: hypothetical protein MR481_06035 [Campylobacter sp.]|uniref:hypothetical protein n=1 Tax=Campylobacter sp. TaxID=205 RepID=UPI002AA6F0BE|nr:hypothetical protein [Campylobacter sp.]MCI7247465.1 hypothetical protein [Campylobacter sp.]